MILGLSLTLMLVLCARAVFDWRSAAYGMIIMTQLQDPVRKIMPGAPSYLVLLSAPVLLAGLFGLVQARPLWWSSFRALNPKVAARALLLVVFCLPAAAISASYGPFSWTYTLLGAASYGLLFLSIVMGYHLLGEEGAFRRLLAAYCMSTALMMTGGWFELLGYFDESLVIGTDALGKDWIRYRTGYTVDLIAGFYRSPDVMGWHAAACAMLAGILALTARGFGRFVWVLVILVALSGLVLCGRRKMAYMLPLFIGLVPLLTFWFGRNRGMATLSVVVGIVVGGGGLLAFGAIDGARESDFLRYYLEGSTESITRVDEQGITTALATLEQSGFLGGGLGFATPGAHSLPFARPRVWQESGTARLMFELGVPGLIALLLLGVALLRGAVLSLRYAASRDQRVLTYCTGLMAFFLANCASLVYSGQILADPFIASFIGMSLGLVLGFRRSDRPKFLRQQGNFA